MTKFNRLRDIIERGKEVVAGYKQTRATMVTLTSFDNDYDVTLPGIKQNSAQSAHLTDEDKRRDLVLESFIADVGQVYGKHHLHMDMLIETLAGDHDKELEKKLGKAWLEAAKKDPEHWRNNDKNRFGVAVSLAFYAQSLDRSYKGVIDEFEFREKLNAAQRGGEARA